MTIKSGVLNNASYRGAQVSVVLQRKLSPSAFLMFILQLTRELVHDRFMSMREFIEKKMSIVRIQCGCMADVIETAPTAITLDFTSIKFGGEK